MQQIKLQSNCVTFIDYVVVAILRALITYRSQLPRPLIQRAVNNPFARLNGTTRIRFLHIMILAFCQSDRFDLKPRVWWQLNSAECPRRRLCAFTARSP